MDKETSKYSLKPEVSYVMEHIWDPEGVTCTECGQFCKAYRRNIYGTQAVQLIDLVQCYLREPDWYDIDGRDLCKLVYWGLVEMEPTDNGATGAAWRPTAKGIRFVRGQTKVPKYCHIYNKELLKQSGDYVSIHDVLPEAFDYQSIWKEAPHGSR